MLALTGEIIRDLNRSHYTVWAWRWRCLEVRAHAEGPLLWVGSPSGRAGSRGGACGQGSESPGQPAGQLHPHPRTPCQPLPPPLLRPAPHPQALGGVAAHARGEFELTAEVAALDAKNYQLWNYRRRLVLALGPAVHAEAVRPLLWLWLWGRPGAQGGPAGGAGSSVPGCPCREAPHPHPCQMLRLTCLLPSPTLPLFFASHAGA